MNPLIDDEIVLTEDGRIVEIATRDVWDLRELVNRYNELSRALDYLDRLHGDST